MKERTLSAGEITLAKTLFKTSIDYSKVKIHNHGYIIGQPNNSGMTPNGEIYVKGIYKVDYSLASVALQAFFVHEMTHVWQLQNCILNPIGSAISLFFSKKGRYDTAYPYTPDAEKDFLDYNMEQQGAIVQDFYRLKSGSNALYARSSKPGKELLVDLRTVMSKFLINPEYAKSCPAIGEDASPNGK